MLETLGSMLADFGTNRTPVLLIGVGLGCLVGLFGLYGAFAGPQPTSRRFRPGSSDPGRQGGQSGLLKERASKPSALMQALIPGEKSQRTRVERDLAHAGMTGRDAVLNFYLVRALLGIGLPGILLGLIYLDGVVTLPPFLAWPATLSRLQMFQYLTILGAAGFYGPAYWLRARANKRKRAVSDGFPNALDLLQISVEAGLGFDAAMSKVAEESRKVSPEISEEFQIAQREILAGRDRDSALIEMADRMNIDEARSFANVVIQSKRFGTEMSEALLTYAEEMRRMRELRAQEKANRLPVQMSAVMASLMLPALVMISLTPVVIRYMNYFAAR